MFNKPTAASATTKATESRSDHRTRSMPSYSPHSSLKSALQLSPLTLKKSVSFRSILIREHSRDINMNPCVSSGPAVGLGWDFQDLPAYDLIAFEENRPPARSRSELQIPRSIRESILQEQGVTRSEIVASVRLINIAKRQRQASLAAQEIEHVVVAREWVTRKVKKMVGKRTTYVKEEEQLWIQAEELARERAERATARPPLRYQ